MIKDLDCILIIDYGSQYTQLIARRIREIEVFCLVYPYNKITKKFLEEIKPSAFILSGGPKSVLDKNSPKLDNNILLMKKPILAICYGMQLIVSSLNGSINKSIQREYGHTFINIKKNFDLFKDIKKNKIKVWMSHGDNIKKIPTQFLISSVSNNKIISSIENKKNKIFCLQFHPEVFHTDFGTTIIKNFITNISKIKNKFVIKNFIKSKVLELKNHIKKNKII